MNFFAGLLALVFVTAEPVRDSANARSTQMELAAASRRRPASNAEYAPIPGTRGFATPLAPASCQAGEASGRPHAFMRTLEPPDSYGQDRAVDPCDDNGGGDVAQPARPAPAPPPARPAPGDDATWRPGTFIIRVFVQFGGIHWSVGGRWTRADPFWVQVPLGPMAGVRLSWILEPENDDAESDDSDS
jgi:hypothetical protein